MNFKLPCFSPVAKAGSFWKIPMMHTGHQHASHPWLHRPLGTGPAVPQTVPFQKGSFILICRSDISLKTNVVVLSFTQSHTFRWAEGRREAIPYLYILTPEHSPANEMSQRTPRPLKLLPAPHQQSAVAPQIPKACPWNPLQVPSSAPIALTWKITQLDLYSSPGFPLHGEVLFILTPPQLLHSCPTSTLKSIFSTAPFPSPGFFLQDAQSYLCLLQQGS